MKDILKFNGKNVGGWLYKITKYFRHYNIRDDKMLFQTTQSLEGETLEWLVWMDEKDNLHF